MKGFFSHAVGIPDFVGEKLRSQDEIDHLKQKDPILLFEKKLLASGIITDQDVLDIRQSAGAEASEAEQFAAEGVNADPVCLETSLYAE